MGKKGKPAPEHRLDRKSRKRYYIMEASGEVKPVAEHTFDSPNAHLRSLADEECSPSIPRPVAMDAEVGRALAEIGFSWETLSEPGHMRLLPMALTATEAIERRAWSVAESFSIEQRFPLFRIGGGELFDPKDADLKRQMPLLSGAYGSNQYHVDVNGTELMLRFSACTLKHSLAKGLDLGAADLPVGIYEVSRSYRSEKETELQLCKRVRDFRIPELHIVTDGMTSALRLALAAHAKVISEITRLDSSYEVMCSLTDSFSKEGMGFLKAMVESIGRPMLLAVYGRGSVCKDGNEIDIEYKTFDRTGLPLEIATVLVDNGSTDFSLGLTFHTKEGERVPVSTTHVVFPFGSIERSAYFLIDRAITLGRDSGYRPLPFWAAPTQVRVIPIGKAELDEAIAIAKRISLSNIRTEVDDRNLRYDVKRNAKNLGWIPCLVTVLGHERKPRLLFEDRDKGNRQQLSLSMLLKEIDAKEGRVLPVPRYLPMLLSRRVAMCS